MPIKLLSLNYDCLGEVIAYLSNIDLLNMCIASDQLKEGILKVDLRKRRFDFSEFRSCHILNCHILNVFKIFGQHMTNIKISEKDIRYELDGMSKFDEILRLIATYCSFDTIRHLDIQYINTSRLKKRFIYKALPFFRRIETFAVSETDGCGTECCVDYFYAVSHQYNKSVNNFIERVLMQAVNVKSIKMNSVKITGRFFHLQLSKLKTLIFFGCDMRDSLGIISFLESRPNLEHFTWVNSSIKGIDSLFSSSSDCIFEAVTNNLTDLETFEYNQNELYFSKNSNKIKWHSVYADINVNSINKFRKLRKLAISPLVWTVELWEILKKKDTIEKISAYPYLLYNNESRTDISPVQTDYQDFHHALNTWGV